MFQSCILRIGFADMTQIARITSICKAYSTQMDILHARIGLDFYRGNICTKADYASFQTGVSRPNAPAGNGCLKWSANHFLNFQICNESNPQISLLLIDCQLVFLIFKQYSTISIIIIPFTIVHIQPDLILNLTQSFQMSIKCGADGSCPLLYECVKNLTCHHKPIFPITNYEYGIFSLFPICSAICNLSGNSFGEFKVLMLMDLLNYQQNQATTIAYPLITGTALYNFFDLIFKRHPTRNTSLIDYNVVLIIIPNILFGSTIGSLVNKFIPPIVADSIIIPIMIGFSIKFFLRYRNFKKQERELETAKANQTQKEMRIQLVQKQLVVKQVQNVDENRSELQKQQRKQSSVVQKEAVIGLTIREPTKNNQLRKLQQYEAGLHLPHVFATILIFLVFETLSFLVQGKIIPFSICSQYYPIGLSVLALLFLFFDFIMFKYTTRRLQYYRQIGYNYDVKIDVPKFFILICIGAFLGGFNGGVFGIGNSTTVIFTLLFMGMEPAIVSATVGYQVVFAGSASLTQAFVTNQIAGNVALLFFLQTFILGGILTFVAKKFVSKFSVLKVNVCLMLVVTCLVTCSVFALIASIVLGYIQFGAQNMQSVPFHC